MSYLVLARKYRPQTFDQVIGQEHVTRTLQNAIKRGRIHHAFLFCGGRGTGKTTTARILAKALSCVNAPTAEPCNQCEACVEITQGTSVDVQEIDAASQNRVEDIRDLREAIRYAPVRGKKRLYILDEVHMLSTSAFNALLKTLEEPPPHAVFVFATTDPHKLPQTILSRVQRYDFKLVPTGRLVDHLGEVLRREGIEFEAGALYIIAREGAGSVRDSLSLLDQVLASAEGRVTEALAASVLGVADRALILSLGQAVAERNAAATLTIVDDAYQRGFDLPQLSRALLSHLRDLVVVSLVKDPQPLLDVPSSELAELGRQAEQVAGRGELLFDRMVRVAEETARASLPRYVLEIGLVELCAVEPLQPIGELVDRLEQVEDRLSGRPSRGGSGGGPASGSGEGSRSPMSATPRQSAAMPERKLAPVAPEPAAMSPSPVREAAPPPVISAPPVREAAPPPLPIHEDAPSPIVVASPVREVAPPPVSEAEPEHEVAPPPVTESAPVREVAPPPIREAAPSPVDAAPPVREAAPPPVVAAPPPVDAAPPPVDAAPPVREAASPPVDAAPPMREAAPPPIVAAPPMREAAPPPIVAAPPVREAAPPPVVAAPPPPAARPVRPPASVPAPPARRGASAAADANKELDSVLKNIAAQHAHVAAAEGEDKAKRKREAVDHPAVKLVREVFPEVSFLEPEVETEARPHG